MAIHLSDFKVARPKYEKSQSYGVEWLASAHSSQSPGEKERYKKLISRFGCSQEDITKRGHELEDFNHTDWDKMAIFDLKHSPCGGSLSSRMKQYELATDRAFKLMYENSTNAPSDLIHVSCTGYIAPSPAQKWALHQGWEGTQVTHAYHMGCYASIPAIRMAQGFLNSGRDLIDVAHTEPCTMHLNPNDHSPEQLVIQSLFADGNIKYSLSKKTSRKSLKLIGCREELIPNSQKDMIWRISDGAMTMGLSKNVPKLVRDSIKPFLNRLYEEHGLEYSKQNDFHFAIHPGGPKIIQKVQEILELSNQQVRHSNYVLKNFGNMSSATLPHIWESMINDDRVKGKIISLAFGPGLTVAGAVMEKQ